MKKRMILVVITIILFATAFVCTVVFAFAARTARNELYEYDSVQQHYTTVFQPLFEGSDMDSVVSETDRLSRVEVDFHELLHANAETVGWIAIPDTVISYPVMQAKNNSKYLSTSFTGKPSGTGTPFIDKDNSIRTLDANTIIYGHNMGTGRSDIFSSLLLYKGYDYFSTHRYIQFDTIYAQGWWKVMAVVEYTMRSEEFSYLRLKFGSDEELLDWTIHARQLSIHDTDMDISAGDNILTLSTCDKSRYGRYGRLLIMAMQIK